MKTNMRAFFTLLIAAAALLMITVVRAAPGPVDNWENPIVAGPNGAYGRMVKLANGNWLMVYTIFPSGQPSQLQFRKSSDNARTWQDVSVIAESGRKVDNGQLVQLSNGTILASMRSLIDGSSYRLNVYKSTNNGVNWQFLSTIDANENPGGRGDRGVWEPHLIQLANGDVAAFYANEKHATESPSYSQIISERISTDGGATWGNEIWVASQPGGGSLRPGMPVIDQMTNGQYIIVFENVNLPNSEIHYKTSGDARTWASGLGTRIPEQGCGPFVRSLSDGRLIVSSCYNNFSYSNDYGQTWLKNIPAPYPGYGENWVSLYQTSTNEVAVMNGGNGGVLIRFATLAAKKTWAFPFNDDFSSGNDADWTRYGGNASVTSGVYMLDNINASGKSLIGDETWTNGALEADINLNTDGQAGLMFRTTNPGEFNPDDAYGYYVGLDGSTIFLGSMSNGYTGLGTVAAPIFTNTWHKLRVEMQGSQIKVYLDGTQRLSVTDSSHARGQIGVRAHYSRAQFDNITFSFFDNFDDGNDSGWTRYGGNYAFTNGAYALNNQSTTGKALVGSSGWSNGILETDFKLTASGQAGVMLRTTNAGTGADAANGYYIGLDGSTLFAGKMNGGWTGLGSTPVSIAQNTTHRLKVAMNGSTFQVYVDDMVNARLTFTDSTYSAGQVGVRAHYGAAEFDNMTFKP
jgi:hypothetical protein